MLIKGSVFKLILGGLFTLGLSAAASGAVYMLFIKPYAPINLTVTIRNRSSIEDCEPAVYFMDNSQNEDEFRMYRRKLGASAFSLIHILPAHPGLGEWIGYVDSDLPVGTYEYKVSAYNKFGETYSDIMQGTVVNSNACAKVPSVDPSTLPMNPIIVSLAIINDCNVRISFRDNSTNEQGFKIVRFTTNGGPATIATLGPHAGIPATYDDKTNLPVGLYGYRIIAYNQKGNLVSNDAEIEVTSVCNPTMKFAPTVDALMIPTAQKLSTETCNWEAAANVFLRKGPNVGIYERLIDEKSGATLPIVGQSEDGQFWAVQVSPGVIGYITKAEIYSRTNGDCSNVPTLNDPAPPVIEAAPTKKPHNNNNGNPTSAPATSCPVGAVCP